MEELLSKLYDKTNDYNKEIIIKLYLTLLSLSNHSFSEESQKKSQEIVNDFLRKLNNLKVKIQLKRKQTEIEKLKNELIDIYYENIFILFPYIASGEELENKLKNLDAKELTNLIDNLTKIKMNLEYDAEKISKIRNLIIDKMPDNEFSIDGDEIIISSESGNQVIDYNDFLSAMSYLLNNDNYDQIYTKEQSKISHDLIINNIIKIILTNKFTKEELEKVAIPVILNSLSLDSNVDINTSNFTVENIKISDLYSLAATEKNINSANYRNINIPNEYLITKLKQMIKKGMYYYQDEKFIFENIENKVSDFKLSISKDNLISFIKETMEITNSNKKTK